MTIKTGIIQKVVALPVTEAKVDREDEIAGSLRVSEIGTLAIVRVTKNAVQSVANNIAVAMIWDQEDFDTAVMHDNSVNNTRLVAPISGKYRLEAVLDYAFDVDGHRDIRYAINGAAGVWLVSVATAPTGNSRVHASTVLDLKAADYVEVEAFHTAGAAIDVETTASHAILQYLGE